MRCAALVLLLTGCIRQIDSPLTLAVRDGNVAQVRTLLASGADPNAPSGGNGWSPLMHAVHKNQVGTASALLDAGAKADFGGPDGYTPLMMAAAYDDKDMVALLLHRGASPRIANAKGETALDFALTGVGDIDRFTLLRCNEETAQLLKRVSPPPSAATQRWAKIKGCA
jgi:ankyrin repeat protein